MKKRTARALALLCTLAMLFTMSAFAFAEEGLVDSLTGQEEFIQWVEMPKDVFEFANAVQADAAQDIAEDPDSQAILECLIEGERKLDKRISIEKWKIPATQAGYDKLSLLWQAAGLDAPELFYVEKAGFVSNGQIYFAVQPQYATDAAAKSVQLEQAVAEALQCVDDGMTDEQKALALHDYLATHIAYDMETLNGRRSYYDAYAALVLQTTVCQGYAETYKLLMNRCDIPCDYICSDGLNHIWNVIQLDGRWYQVDVTWDDPTQDLTGRAAHNYFLRSDTGIGHKNENGTTDWETTPSNWKPVKVCSDDTKHENAFWKDTTAPVVFDGDVTYYVQDVPAQANAAAHAGLFRHEGNTKEELYQWERWPSERGWWIGCYSGLSRNGNSLYWNDSKNIYQWEIGSKDEPKAVYTLSDTDGYIWGSHYQDGEMEIAVTATPNPQAERTISTIRLSSETGTEKVALNKLELTLKAGGTETLYAAVTSNAAGNKTVTWSSSNPAAATVDANGKVTAVAAGSTTITASVGGASASCAVTVTAVPGDANGDGEVDIFDLAAVKNYILDNSTKIDTAAADMTGDGEIDIFDLMQIKQYILNKGQA